MKYFRHLDAILRRRGRSREEAEDLIQETFLRVKMYVDGGGEVREPEAFLVRTALNLARDRRQREHRELYTSNPLEDLDLVDSLPGPEELLEREQRLDGLKRALNRAGPRAREVFLMHRLEGMTYAQIASQLDVSVSAVEKHMAKALMTLGRAVLES